MIALPLEQMSQVEKLMAMEALWADLSQDEAALEPPAWHQDELAATEARVKSGQEAFVDWGSAKKNLQSRFE